MTYFAFFVAALGLLLTPGPTNTLILLAGATMKPRCALKLIVGEVAGYSIAILTVALLGKSIITCWPSAGDAIKMVAALWLIYLAIRLWQSTPEIERQGSVTIKRVFFTTMFNPKSLLFGLVLLPAFGSIDFFVKGVTLISLIVVVAIAFASLGFSLSQSGGCYLQQKLFQKASACWIGAIAFGLTVSVIPRIQA